MMRVSLGSQVSSVTTIREHASQPPDDSGLKNSDSSASWTAAQKATPTLATWGGDGVFSTSKLASRPPTRVQYEDFELCFV